MVNSELIKVFQDRGYLHQCTNLENLDKLASSEIVAGYIGFDCTAKSLHVGSLIPIMMLRNLQKAGHKPLVIMGGGTTKIGDPSGKDEARKLLTDEIIEENKISIFKVFEKFLKFGDGPTDAIMIDNAEWFNDIKYIDFLRDVGPHFSINKMLTFDSVKLRLDREQSLTFLEFNYMILQGYDFVELFRRYNCRLEMGGSDQWGNIVSGVDLGRRMGCQELYGLTSPLITTKSGAKMGKSVAGAVWLNADYLSPYDYWQFWRNTEDGDVIRFLKLFTDLPLDQIEKLSKIEGKELNEVKILLANEATTLCHGEEFAREAYESAKKTFEQGESGAALPIFNIEINELKNGVAAYKIFVITGMCDSNGAAKRLIKGRGAKINNKIVEDENATIDESFIVDGIIKLSFGQKSHLLVRVS